jgi:hypothetical protein
MRGGVDEPRVVVRDRRSAHDLPERTHALPAADRGGQPDGERNRHRDEKRHTPRPRDPADPCPDDTHAEERNRGGVKSARQAGAARGAAVLRRVRGSLVFS